MMNGQGRIDERETQCRTVQVERALLASLSQCVRDSTIYCGPLRHKCFIVTEGVS